MDPFWIILGLIFGFLILRSIGMSVQAQEQARSRALPLNGKDPCPHQVPGTQHKWEEVTDQESGNGYLKCKKCGRFPGIY